MTGELVPMASEVASVDDLRRFLGWLHEQWRRDPEIGHSIDDEIRERVLQMVRGHDHPDAAVLARAVLVTSTCGMAFRAAVAA